MRVADIIKAKLTAGLQPEKLNVVDDSARHAGHAGATPGGESHFQLEIVSAAFSGKSRVQRQRLVYQLLAAELNGPVHALSLVTRAPDEVVGTAQNNS
jgi:BolA family transcriptional regulator, general stress-responsive regulator